MDQKLQESAPVLFNEQVAQGIYRMSMHAPGIAKSAAPGQFVQVKVSSEPSIQFLRMPFAVFGVDAQEGTVDVCYQVLGEGTRQLSMLKTSDSVDLIGPLGNGWSIPEGCKHALLAGGGVGTPALRMLAEELARAGAKVDVVIGATTAERLSCVDEMQDACGCGEGRVLVSTDDGSYGVKGFVNAITDDLISSGDIDYVAVCGPLPMEKSVCVPAVEHGLKCEVSMEKLMACGVGACLACVVETANGLKRCCVDGPVFDASEVVW